MKRNHMLPKVLFVIGSLFFLSFALDFAAEQDAWVVPDKYKNKVNPIAANSESLKSGQRLYDKHCKSCHGKEGLGDGSKAAQLDTPAGDFSSQEFQSQTDGAIFYKTWCGRDEMPNYEKKIPYEEDVWHIVNYMRTFKP